MQGAASERALQTTARASVILAAIALVGFAYVARHVLVPIALGLVLAAILWPVVRALERVRVPSAAAATLAILGALAVLVATGLALEAPLRDLRTTVPKSVAAARAKLGRLAAPWRRMNADLHAPAPPASSPAASASPGAPSSPPATAAPRPSADSVTNSEAKGPAAPGSEGALDSPSATASGAGGTIGRALDVTTSLLGAIVEVLLVALFLLAAGRAWEEKLRRAVRPSARAEPVLAAATEMRSVVVRYLFVTMLINAGQALVIALALWALHFPSPALWGALTFVAEFIPYFGGMVMIALLLVTGLATTPSLFAAVLPALVYLTVTSVQNNVVSPVAYGKGLRLNPTAILLGVMAWWALWGVAGAFLAVPILACFRVLAARVEALEAAGVFLEE
jgi:predicted PurR-regulated permease PerM